MDLYHIWCNLKPGTSDIAFADNVARYLGHLREHGKIEGWRMSRRKLGLGPAHLGEFHIQIELAGLQQLDEAFAVVAGRRDPVETFHHAVNLLVTDVTFALYRDFPDPLRHRGEEKF